MPQGAPSLAAAPAALELPLRLQTHAAAVPLGRALVQVHCGEREPPSLFQINNCCVRHIYTLFNCSIMTFSFSVFFF